MSTKNKNHSAMPILSAFADESSNDFEEQLDAVIRNGFTHIEIRGVDGATIHKHPLEKVRSLKARANDAGIAFSAVGSGLGKCNVNDDMDEQREACRHLVEVAHALKAPYIRMFSFRIPKNDDPKDYRQKVIDGLGSFIEVVKGSGVALAHENEKHIYGETAERCRDLYETFYHTGCFKGVFDFANFVQAGENPLTDCWPLLKDYTEYFHVKDALLADGRVVPAGHGDGGLREILTDSFQNGFDSFLTLEPHLGPKYFEGDSAQRFDLAAQSLVQLLEDMNG